MTNMDDQIAKHCKNMLLKIQRKDTFDSKLPSEAEETLRRAVRALRGELAYPSVFTRPSNTKG